MKKTNIIRLLELADKQHFTTPDIMKKLDKNRMTAATLVQKAKNEKLIERVYRVEHGRGVYRLIKGGEILLNTYRAEL